MLRGLVLRVTSDIHVRSGMTDSTFSLQAHKTPASARFQCTTIQRLMLYHLDVGSDLVLISSPALQRSAQSYRIFLYDVPLLAELRTRIPCTDAD